MIMTRPFKEFLAFASPYTQSPRCFQTSAGIAQYPQVYGGRGRELMTTANNLISIGLICCLAALAIQVFPDAAFRIGADPGASWLMFGFGAFLILVAALIATGGRRRN
jgi:hypothetical protein